MNVNTVSVNVSKSRKSMWGSVCTYVCVSVGVLGVVC